VASSAEILTVHQLRLDGATAAAVVERFRAALPQYLAELEGLLSAELYRTKDGVEVMLVGRWRDYADVMRAMETIYAKPELRETFHGERFEIYELLFSQRREGPDTGRAATTVVPPPRGLATTIVPPSASTRSRRPISPDPPPGSAPPIPSSPMDS
jgi:heme-degrading monooxygenase HmoA